MPGGQCGSWPAYWLKGPQAPAYSELDIIEGVNLDSTSLMSVKTSQACSIGQQPMTGTLKTTDCNMNTGGIVGCSINSGSPATYGTGFNSIGGGVYATEWTSDAITIWFFPRNGIPTDITTGRPNPQLWGVPLSKFVPNCRLDDSFVNQNIVMNIDFCGDYAADPFFYNQYPTCTSQAASCNDFVKNNPGAFTETYWRINQLKVYQISTASTTSSSTSSPSPVSQSITSGSSSSLSTTSRYVDITTSGTYVTSTGSFMQPSSSNILPIGGSTTSSAGYSVFTSGLSSPSSSNIQPVGGSTTTSSGIYVFTPGLPPQPTTSSSFMTISASSPSLSSSGTSSTAPLSSAIGPVGGSTTSTAPQSTNGPVLGSTSASSSQSLASSSSFAVDPNLGSTSSSTSAASVAQSTSTWASTSTPTSTSTSSYSGMTTSRSLSKNNSNLPSTSSKVNTISGQAGHGGWSGQGVSSTVITTTLKGKQNF